MTLGESADMVAMTIMVATGIALNVFNLIFTVQQLWKAKSVQTVNLIISSISLNNIILVLSCFYMVLDTFMEWDLFCESSTHPFILTLLYLWLSSSSISVWSIAHLSVFYCIKVVTFSRQCLKALKTNISSIINAAVLVTYPLALCMFSPMLTLSAAESDSGYSTINSTWNATSNVTKCPSLVFMAGIDPSLFTLIFVCFLCLFPLMTMLPTSLRLVVHLCGHTLSLRKNQTQVQSADSYLLVCKLTISLVGVYLTTLAFVSIFFLSALQSNRISYTVIVFSFSFYVIMTAGLLTASNKFLKDKLWGLSCCKKPQEASSKSQTETEKGSV
ncbi:taste receptor, type 2, member 200, tandem duplicate 1 [Chanos chanos]|uniref:Taste receptor type 2 n=1 Tax=Chanos chanos TaxID=29144 RepID=A0A6J2UM97_CHACN|nr:taste receptor type 2 member 20 [Chanos chanos]